MSQTSAPKFDIAYYAKARRGRVGKYVIRDRPGRPMLRFDGQDATRIAEAVRFGRAL